MASEDVEAVAMNREAAFRCDDRRARRWTRVESDLYLAAPMAEETEQCAMTNVERTQPGEMRRGQGYSIRKSRRDGSFMVVDPFNNVVVGGGRQSVSGEYGMSLEDVEAWLREPV